MPSQFTPADRETVKEQAEKMPSVHDVGPCGPGLIIIEEAHDSHRIRNWHGVTETCGWRIDKHIPKEDGDIVIIFPITEVPRGPDGGDGGDGDADE